MLNGEVLDAISGKISNLELLVASYDGINENKGIEIYSTISAIIFQLDIFEIRNLHLDQVRALKARCESLRTQVVIFRDKYMKQFEELAETETVENTVSEPVVEAQPTELVDQEPIQQVEQIPEQSMFDGFDINKDDVPVSMESSMTNEVEKGGQSLENSKVLSIAKPKISYDRAA